MKQQNLEQHHARHINNATTTTTQNSDLTTNALAQCTRQRCVHTWLRQRNTTTTQHNREDQGLTITSAGNLSTCPRWRSTKYKCHCWRYGAIPSSSTCTWFLTFTCLTIICSWRPQTSVYIRKRVLCPAGHLQKTVEAANSNITSGPGRKGSEIQR